MRNSTVAIEITGDYAEIPIRIKINGDKFKRITSNFPNNAIEAAPDEAGRVVVAVKNQDTRIEVSICDNGPGFPKEILLDQGRQRISLGKINGNGLGIAHARETIEESGGTLNLQNSWDGGARVAMSVPIHVAENAA